MTNLILLIINNILLGLGIGFLAYAMYDKFFRKKGKIKDKSIKEAKELEDSFLHFIKNIVMPKHIVVFGFEVYTFVQGVNDNIIDILGIGRFGDIGSSFIKRDEYSTGLIPECSIIIVNWEKCRTYFSMILKTNDKTNIIFYRPNWIHLGKEEKENILGRGNCFIVNDKNSLWHQLLQVSFSESIKKRLTY